MYRRDVSYIRKLAKGLNIHESEPLNIIMGPQELKDRLSMAKPEDFLGPCPRINLHTHSNASDGQLSPVRWVENACGWMRKKHLAEYIIALTDHDTIDGLIPVLKYVVKNHDKLKGLRIVLGCELSVSFENDMLRRPVDFEILHYGINPFDKNYVQLLKKQAQNRHAQLPKLFREMGQKYPQLQMNLKAFHSSCFYGANMQKGLGVNWLYDTMAYFKSIMPKGCDARMIFDEMTAFGFEKEKRGLWYPAEKMLEVIGKHGGFASMAHPYRLQLEQKLNGNVTAFISCFFKSLSQKGLMATELYYGQLKQMQPAFDKIMNGGQPAGDTERWIQLIQKTSRKFFPFATGGSDNHDAYLGNGQYRTKDENWQNLIDYWHAIQPLIERGYRVLNKEVTMELPGPCMPIFDEGYDLGIGSPYGAGAQRVWQFWDKTVHKILLGPGGRTNKQTKHSPYVSDEEYPNPFFVPLEYLQNQGLLDDWDLIGLKHPDSSERIDFEKVEKISIKYKKKYPAPK